LEEQKRHRAPKELLPWRQACLEVVGCLAKFVNVVDR
jgi:hypothetical protein